MQAKIFKRLRFIGLLLCILIVIFSIRYFLIDWVHVEGNSMSPTLSDGQIVFVEKISKVTSSINRGDLVLIVFPDGIQYTKRVIAIGGDIISLSNNTLRVNWEAVEEPYLSEPRFNNIEPLTIPEDHVFVMGDNRDISLDSRDYRVGSIHKNNIIGKILH